MLESVKKVNGYFKTATRADVNKLLSEIILSERQEKIFEMFYIKRNDIGFIADSLNVSESVIKRELKVMRDKVLILL